ncbi:MAG: hypothetical protein ACRD8U_03345, partial [Pyrinomonadaceae bacterium]
MNTFQRIRTFLLIVALVNFLPAARVRSQTPPSLDGFTPEGSAAQRRREEQFRAVPKADSAREHLKRLTAEPHVAGTKEDYATAIYVRDQLRSYG